MVEARRGEESIPRREREDGRQMYRTLDQCWCTFRPIGMNIGGPSLAAVKDTHRLFSIPSRVQKSINRKLNGIV